MSEPTLGTWIALSGVAGEGARCGALLEQAESRLLAVTAHDGRLLDIARAEVDRRAEVFAARNRSRPIVGDHPVLLALDSVFDDVCRGRLR